MHILADVQRITLNASCMTNSGRRTEQLDIITGFVPRHWLYEWFYQFHSYGTYSVLSRSPSVITDGKAKAGRGVFVSDAKPTGLPVQRVSWLPAASPWDNDPWALRAQHGLSSLQSAGHRQQPADTHSLPAAVHHGEWHTHFHQTHTQHTHTPLYSRICLLASVLLHCWLWYDMMW